MKKINQTVRDLLALHLRQGRNIRFFANGQYYEMTELSFDGCGNAVLKLEEVGETDKITPWFRPK